MQQQEPHSKISDIDPKMFFAHHSTIWAEKQTDGVGEWSEGNNGLIRNLLET